MAYAICVILSTPIHFWWASRRGPVNLRQLTAAIVPFALAAACCIVVVTVLDGSFEGTRPILVAALLAASYTTTLLALLVTRAGRSCVARARVVAMLGFDMMGMRMRSFVG
jgi:hypothetical protein